MVERRREVLVIGIGNVLWADEGFGVRAVEALHDAFAFPDGVVLMDGGTQGLNLLEDVACSRRVLVFDAVDYALRRGRSRCCVTTRCRRGVARSSRRTRPASTTCSRMPRCRGGDPSASP